MDLLYIALPIAELQCPSVLASQFVSRYMIYIQQLMMMMMLVGTIVLGAYVNCQHHCCSTQSQILIKCPSIKHHEYNNNSDGMKNCYHLTRILNADRRIVLLKYTNGSSTYCSFFFFFDVHNVAISLDYLVTDKNNNNIFFINIIVFINKII